MNLENGLYTEQKLGLQNPLIILTSRARCQTGPSLERHCGLWSQGFINLAAAHGPEKWSERFVHTLNHIIMVQSKRSKRTVRQHESGWSPLDFL